jgi:hypothetical protein
LANNMVPNYKCQVKMYFDLTRPPVTDNISYIQLWSDIKGSQKCSSKKY